MGAEVSQTGSGEDGGFITSVEELHRFLAAALQLEHATIPPYLVALYSIHPETNPDAFHIIRVVAVEEMLHLTLAANILNAVGGDPDLTVPNFVPMYPSRLPDGEDDFEVGLERFSEDAVETFLKIERGPEAPTGAARLVSRDTDGRRPHLAATHHAGDMHFYSIGEFYRAIEDGLVRLESELSAEGKSLFVGAEDRQVTAEYYYSGGGRVIEVKDLRTARAAIRLISEQGEGLGGEIYDKTGELAHYRRFEQLLLGRYYQPGDRGEAPTGPKLEVEWEEVYPIKTSPVRLADYREGSELGAAVADLNESYAGFLRLLTKAFTGQRELLMEAVPYMFRLRERMNQIMRNPMPGADGLNAAPTFEVPGVTPEARS
jgi:hypothetical protein